jgi:hypothetical protein
MRAWYMATWVNAPCPVTSPTAQTPSVTRRCSSTGSDRDDGSTPIVSVPIAARSTRRPVATSSCSAVRVRPSARVTVNPSVVSYLGGADPVTTSIPSPRTPRRGGRRPAAPRAGAAVGGLDDGGGDAEAGVHLGQLGADGPAAEHDHRRRQLLGLDRLTVGPVRGVGEPGDRRDRGVVPVATTTPAPRAERGRRPVTASGRRAGRARGRTCRPCRRTARRRPCRPSRRWPRPGCAGRPGPSRRDGRGAGETGDSACLGEQVGGADHHLRRDAPPVGALTADQAGLDADDLEPGLGEPTGDVLASGPHADDDHVDLGGSGGVRPSAGRGNPVYCSDSSRMGNERHLAGCSGERREWE